MGKTGAKMGDIVPIEEIEHCIDRHKVALNLAIRDRHANLNDGRILTLIQTIRELQQMADTSEDIPF